MKFFGKYTFQSTNAVGDKKYLTIYTSQGDARVLMLSETVTPLEQWILYQNDNGNLVFQSGMLVIQKLRYLAGDNSIGVIINEESVLSAGIFRINIKEANSVSLQIFIKESGAWDDILYTVNTLNPILGYSSATSQELLDSEPLQYFNKGDVTPSLAFIQGSKNAKGLDFTYVDLTNADFTGVNCTGADFRNAILDGVIFSGANLTNAKFQGASFNKTQFTNKVILDNANFTEANLTTVVWGEGISAQGTIFDSCVAIGCEIGTANSQMKNNFSDAQFRNSDFSYSNFDNVDLQNAFLASGVFVGGVFNQTNFFQAVLGGSIGVKAANFGYAFMTDVNFKSANLFGVSFAYACVFGASTNISESSTMAQTDFSNAYLEGGVNMVGAKLEGAKFNNAFLAQIDFSNAVFDATGGDSIFASLNGACLQGATFTKASLVGADLTNATISFGDVVVNVRHCDPDLRGSFPPPPDFEPINIHKTKGLDLLTMSSNTVCPNGITVEANKALGKTLKEMLTVENPATQWIPVRCSFLQK